MKVCFFFERKRVKVWGCFLFFFKGKEKGDGLGMFFFFFKERRQRFELCFGVFEALVVVLGLVLKKNTIRFWKWDVDLG